MTCSNEGFIRPKRGGSRPECMIEEPESRGPESVGAGLPRGLGVGGLAVLVALIVVAGLIVAWLGGNGILPVSPTMAVGMAMAIATIVACCGSLSTVGAIASRMSDYGEMETKFEEGMAYYEAGEWEEALRVFNELMGPRRDHKRALYYSARCYEQLGDWDRVKEYCKLYLRMQPKDAEVWELLATAHKRLFEYGEAEDAEAEARKYMDSRK